LKNYEHPTIHLISSFIAATFSFPQRLYNSVAMQPSRLQRRAGSLCSISPCVTVHKSGSSKQRPSGRNNSKTRERGAHGKPRRPSHARRQTTRVRARERGVGKSCCNPINGNQYARSHHHGTEQNNVYKLNSVEVGK
jgi:hypothetical protein